VRFGGGGATSSLWAQILADALDSPVEQLASPGTTNARGAAFLALDILGHRSLDDVPAMLEIAARYEPDAAAVATYAPMRERFIDLHALLRPAPRPG
jgi:xylulokinase